MAGFVTLNPDGLLSISDLQESADSAERSLDSQRAIRDSLAAGNLRLASDSTAIEAAVREILGWGRPGEFLVRIDSTPGDGR